MKHAVWTARPSYKTADLTSGQVIAYGDLTYPNIYLVCFDIISNKNRWLLLDNNMLYAVGLDDRAIKNVWPSLQEYQKEPTWSNNSQFVIARLTGGQIIQYNQKYWLVTTPVYGKQLWISLGDGSSYDPTHYVPNLLTAVWNNYSDFMKDQLEL